MRHSSHELLRVVAPVLLGLALAGCGAAGPFTEPGGSRVVWQVNTRGWGIPAVDNDAAYYLTEDHQLVAVSRTDGAVLSRRTLFAGLTNPPGFTAIISGPVVAAIDNGVLYAFSRVGMPGAGWTFRPPTGGLEDWITTDGATIYAGANDGRVYAVDAASGALRWVTVVGVADAQCTGPRVSNGVVFTGYHRVVAPSEGGMTAVDAATGALRWTRAFVSAGPGRGAGSPGQAVFLADGTVVVASDDGQIHALDPATGVPRWTVGSLTGVPATWGGNPALDMRPLVVSGRRVVAGSTTGYLVALDDASGAELWRSRADQGSAFYPLVSDGQLVYATHFGGQLAAFDLQTGAVRWVHGSTRSGGAYAQAPRLFANTLYISGFEGLFALRAGE